MVNFKQFLGETNIQIHHMDTVIFILSKNATDNFLD